MAKSSKLDQQLCFEVYKASSNFSKLYARTLEPFQLTFTQYLVLLALWEEDYLLTKDIGNRLGLGIGTLNPIINRMIDSGWLHKIQCDKDKRAFIISLTEKAKREKKPIEKAIMDKIISCNFLDINTQTLMSNLKGLNNFLTQVE
ncbi:MULTISPECIES: MarR family winged helix-turn-helix transcriptional regulator [Bacillaceae]|uniref:MarR family winged helix-turn-helix transcriptional regulator n=1 Tax=Bacillaceae TaxID=186817 RepID=UPI0006ADD583|nr:MULTISPECIES: MarR family transcriptional regulator [Bacillaceae]ALC87477.1 MarR family transcriptional regulator [Bacillus sp. FJAT-22090]KQL34854.1 MarR family transcriptional regulator [Psychrobacillus sp. FJAT-21963]